MQLIKKPTGQTFIRAKKGSLPPGLAKYLANKKANMAQSPTASPPPTKAVAQAPSTGKMPPALASYWANKRAGKA